MAKCQHCGKGRSFGRNVSHSQVRTRRTFDANIQKFVVMKDGKPTSVKLCTRCARTLAKS